MKLFKKIATLCMALSLCVGVAAFAACGGDKETSSQPSTNSSVSSTPDSSVADSSDDTSAGLPNPTTAGYHFRVLNADGTPATSRYSVLLCKADTCSTPIPLDKNGCATYDGNVNGFWGEGEAYDIHVCDGENWNEYVEFEGIQKTPTSYSMEYIVLTLK